MILDIVVLVVLLISAGIAFMRGFIREVLTIAGVAGGLAGAWFCGPVLVPFMNGWLGVEDGVDPALLFGILPYDLLSQILSYGLIFILIVIILSFASHMLAEAARSIGLGAIDRTLGFLFGLIRGVLLLGLLYLPLHLFANHDAKQAWFGESRAQIYLEKTAQGMASYLPKNAEDAMAQGQQSLDEAVSARETLQGIDLLQGKGEASPPDAPPLNTDPKSIQNPDGYTEGFRDQMDQLFDEKARQLNE